MATAITLVGTGLLNENCGGVTSAHRNQLKEYNKLNDQNLLAASTNRAGNAAAGGDWNLEYQTGKINLDLALRPEVMQSYQNTLAIYTVLNANDTGTGSLRAAITTANGTVGVADTIRFDTTGVFATAQTIFLTSGVLNITDSVDIQGTGASNLKVDGSSASQVFNISGAGVTVNIDGMTIANGKITGNGGGINVGAGSTLNLSNSTVSGNSANSGGGIYNKGTATITNTTISDNTTSANGGAIFNNSGGTVNLTNSVISNNSSFNGGGINNNNSTISITDSTISGNRSYSGGTGAGLINSGTATVTNSTISSNSASNLGGGIRNLQTLTLINSTISGNSGNASGGGIYNDSGVATITNSTITNNTADGDNNDTGNGGGIFRAGGTVNVQNTIVAGNFDTPNNAGSGTINPDVSGTFTNQGNNLIGINQGSTNFVNGTNGNIVGTFATRVNPQLAALGDYGGTTKTHALLPGSAAINAGNNTGATTTDQRGATRIVGGTIDIGAYESAGFGLTPTGTPQSTAINTAFATPLQLQVIELAFNKPLPAPGVSITFTVPSSGASGTLGSGFTLVTDSTGKVTNPFTANGVGGTYTVTASATGLTSATFNLTNIAPTTTTKFQPNSEIARAVQREYAPPTTALRTNIHHSR